ncbi:hypothetical protein BH24DEI2_BH24DEI2_19650 [soil metagenome]
MNRAHRRRALAWRKKEALAKMRVVGCTCAPSFDPVDPATVVGVKPWWGFMIGHNEGCPYGDHIAAVNALGFTPALLNIERRGCGR